MTFEAFEQLSEEQKLKTLMTEGRVISEKRDSEYQSFLYYLGSFYVKVNFDIATDDLVSTEALRDIDGKDRTEWKVLRMLPALKQVIKAHSNGLL
jgi:hypothetical protein